MADDANPFAKFKAPDSAADAAANPFAKFRPADDAAKPADAHPRWDVVGDVVSAVSGAAEQLGSDVDTAAKVAGPAEDIRKSAERHKNEPWYQRFPAEFGDSITSDLSRMGSALRVPLDALGVPGAAVPGALHATLGSLLSYLPGVSKQQADQGIDQALLGMRPSKVSTARGAIPPPPGAPSRTIPAGYDAARDISATDKGLLNRDVDFRRDVERPPKTGQVQIPETYDPAADTEKPSSVRAGSDPLAHRAITEDRLALPPHMVSETPPLATEMAASAGGKLKTEQMASVRNEPAIDRLAAKAAGVPEGTELSEAALDRAKAPHDAAYQQVQDKVPEIRLDFVDRSRPGAPARKVDQIFGEVARLSEVDGETATVFRNSAVPPSVRAFQNKVRADLGNVMKQGGGMPTSAVMGLIRSYRAQAAKTLRNHNSTPSDQWLGLAQRKAADALEGLIERNLIRLESEQRIDPRLRTVEGKPGDFYVNKPDPELAGVMKAWRDARVALAKIHMVEDALNPGTGHIRTAWIARQLQKGAPLTDELRRIGEYGLRFPKALRESAQFGGAEKHSALDYFSALLSLGHGNPAVAGAVWARPAARSYALSPGAQRSLVTPRQPVGPAFLIGIMQSGQLPNAAPDISGILQALGIQ